MIIAHLSGTCEPGTEARDETPRGVVRVLTFVWHLSGRFTLITLTLGIPRVEGCRDPAAAEIQRAPHGVLTFVRIPSGFLSDRNGVVMGA